ncbi:MAG: hypothetical protein WAM78_00450, partial [Candidatus Sulfotelmatobacter sp.]
MVMAPLPGLRPWSIQDRCTDAVFSPRGAAAFAHASFIYEIDACLKASLGDLAMDDYKFTDVLD